MKIKSVSDVVTNSSSEVFIIRKDKNIRSVDYLRMIREYHESHSLDLDIYDEKYQGKYEYHQLLEILEEEGLDFLPSGDGGEIDIFDDSRPGYVEIIVDKNYKATCNYILSTFKKTRKK